jgi:hypothetical protein
MVYVSPFEKGINMWAFVLTICTNDKLLLIKNVLLEANAGAGL